MTVSDITEVIKTVGAILVPVVAGVITYKIAKLNTMAQNNNAKLNSKIDSYHTEVNGKMDEQLTTTRKLGEKVGADKNQKITDAKPQDQK